MNRFAMTPPLPGIKPCIYDHIRKHHIFHISFSALKNTYSPVRAVYPYIIKKQVSGIIIIKTIVSYSNTARPRMEIAIGDSKVAGAYHCYSTVSYTHLRAHETGRNL